MSLEAPQIICELCLRVGETRRAGSVEVTSGKIRVRTYLCDMHMALAEDPSFVVAKWASAPAKPNPEP